MATRSSIINCSKREFIQVFRLLEIAAKEMVVAAVSHAVHLSDNMQATLSPIGRGVTPPVPLLLNPLEHKDLLPKHASDLFDEPQAGCLRQLRHILVGNVDAGFLARKAGTLHWHVVS